MYVLSLKLKTSMGVWEYGSVDMISVNKNRPTANGQLSS
jgi:hypothetical protein